MHAIYVLLCPESGAVRYVGVTKAPLNHRLSNHISESRRRSDCHRHSWIRGLLRRGLKPNIRLDVEISVGSDWQDVERERIAYYRSLGADLVNGTDGGIGLFKPNLEVRTRMSGSAKKRQWTEEGLDRQRANGKRSAAINKGRPKSPEHREKMRLAKLGQKHTKETLRKMSVTRKGRKYSEEHRAAIRAGKLRYEAAKRREA